MSGRVQMRCDGCGQTDDHPKHHYGAQTFHHDCTPAYVIDDMTGETFYKFHQDIGYVMADRVQLDESDYSEGTKKFLKIREAAQKGKRGDDLLAHIQKMHEEK